MIDSKQIEKVKHALLEHKQVTKPRSIVLKLGTDCNLRCEYCYVEHLKDNTGLSVETVEKLFDELMTDNASNIDCCFHGGEPFLYFDKMKKILEMLSSKPYAKQIRYSCQSNGTLLTDKIVDFIKEHRISIGISIDGPKQVNDILRKYANGKGSFDAIIEGIKKLIQNKIGFSVLSVLSNQNIDYVIETLTFLKELGIPIVDLKPCFRTNLSDHELTPELYTEAMIKVVDWLMENNTPQSCILVREVEMYTTLIMHQKHMSDCYDCRSMCDILNCGAGRDHITVDTFGNIYICDRLYGHEEYILGNINNESLDTIMRNPLIKTFLSRRISVIDECRDCDENRICFLGCPATNILQNQGRIEGINMKPDYCEYYKRIIKKLREVIEQGDYHKLIRTGDKK